MSLKIVIRPKAKADIIDQAAFIGEDNLSAGMRFVQAAEETFERLAEMPGMGTPRQCAGRELANLRSWRVRGFEHHLVFYRSVDEGIEVIRVLHGARDLERILEED